MSWKKFFSMQVIVICLILAGVNSIAAQQGSGALRPKGNNSSLFEKPKKPLPFPKTEKEIVNIFDVPLPIRQGTRGLEGIKDDELPKAGADVLFYFDSVKIKPESLPLLEEFANAFRNERLQKAVFKVAGYTDSIGDEQYNLELSRRRAEAIKHVLASQYQIAENRLFVEFYGENKPLESNETTEGRAKNRRVEFIRIQ